MKIRRAIKLGLAVGLATVAIATFVSGNYIGHVITPRIAESMGIDYGTVDGYSKLSLLSYVLGYSVGLSSSALPTTGLYYTLKSYYNSGNKI